MTLCNLFDRAHCKSEKKIYFNLNVSILEADSFMHIAKKIFVRWQKVKKLNV